MIYTIKTATTDEHLNDILVLQQANLKQSISEIESKEQGFVSVVHDFDLLKKMNQPHPHIIGVDQNDKVIAYALVMLPILKNEVEMLKPMFRMMDNELWLGKVISKYPYLVMGQICVAKDYRGEGIFYRLYEKLSEQMSNAGFELIVTEVSKFNRRSAKAHAKAGFKLIKSYSDTNDLPWDLIVLAI